MIRHLFAAVLFGVALVPSLLRGQQVVPAPAGMPSLQNRWSWAAEKAEEVGKNGGIWVGYSIERLMEADSWIGSFDRFEDKACPSLYEMITGRRIEHADPHDLDEDLRKTAERELSRTDAKRIPAPLVKKEVAFLFRFDGAKVTGEGLWTIRTSNITLHVNLEDLPLLWLGKSTTEESMDLLTQLYADVSAEKLKQKIISAVGLHGPNSRVLSFLKREASGEGGTKVRKEALFWVGRQDTEEALDFLVGVVEEETSRKILEHAIFSISQVSLERATDELITIGRSSRNLEARKKAVFWLGQKASRKALETLKGVVYNDVNVEVQKQAVFALTQVDDGGVDEIIRIARTHPHPAVRKQAIFWLGQSDDPRAFDVIVEIAKGE